MQEQVIVLYLNRANKVIGYYRHTTGGVNSTIMDVKLIISTALKSLSSGIIIAHNHPSGDQRPSIEDTNFTKRMSLACEAVGLSLLDHLVFNHGPAYSFRIAGLV